MTVRDLKMAMDLTLKAGATPHRDIYWEKLDMNAEIVSAQLLFIEEYNTGYNGVLERWLFTVLGGPFMLDLLPGFIKSVKSTVA